MDLVAVAFWGLVVILIAAGLIHALDRAFAWFDGRHFRRRLREQRRLIERAQREVGP